MQSRSEVIAFLRARLARLAPTCVASTLIVVAVGAATGQHLALGDVVRTLLVFPLLIEPMRSINLPMWSCAAARVSRVLKERSDG